MPLQYARADGNGNGGFVCTVRGTNPVDETRKGVLIKETAHSQRPILMEWRGGLDK